MPETGDLPCSSRALIALAQAASAQHRARRSPPRAAGFLAHLIATADKLPQARERRRADPHEVIAAYRATIARIRALDDQ